MAKKFIIEQLESEKKKGFKITISTNTDTHSVIAETEEEMIQKARSLIHSFS